MREVTYERSYLNFIMDSMTLYGFDQKNQFFEGCSWLKLNNLGLALGMTLEFYTGVEEGLKLKVRKFWGLITTFVEVTG